MFPLQNVLHILLNVPILKYFNNSNRVFNVWYYKTWPSVNGFNWLTNVLVHVSILYMYFIQQVAACVRVYARARFASSVTIHRK